MVVSRALPRDGTPGLLHREIDLGAPGDVNLVPRLDLIKHLRIDDPAAVFPPVWPDKGHRRRALVDVGDGCRHRPHRRCGAAANLA